MEKIAVFVNDAAHARHLLQPMISGPAPTHWIVVACAPRLTRHIGRWVSHAAREQWLARWSGELFAAIEPELRTVPGNRVDKLLAKRSLVDVSARLEARHGPLRLLDARRPRLGQVDEALSAGQPASGPPAWAGPVAALAGVSAMLSLAD